MADNQGNIVGVYVFVRQGYHDPSLGELVTVFKQGSPHQSIEILTMEAGKAHDGVQLYEIYVHLQINGIVVRRLMVNLLIMQPFVRHLVFQERAVPVVIEWVKALYYAELKGLYEAFTMAIVHGDRLITNVQAPNIKLFELRQNQLARMTRPNTQDFTLYIDDEFVEENDEESPVGRITPTEDSMEDGDAFSDWIDSSLDMGDEDE